VFLPAEVVLVNWLLCRQSVVWRKVNPASVAKLVVVAEDVVATDQICIVDGVSEELHPAPVGDVLLIEVGVGGCSWDFVGNALCVDEVNEQVVVA
jgi:hypothetical protein